MSAIPRPRAGAQITGGSVARRRVARRSPKHRTARRVERTSALNTNLR